jgi:hypothetical protein
MRRSNMTDRAAARPAGWGKNSPIARAVRTIFGSLAAGLVALTAVDWATDWRYGVSQLTLLLISSLLAGAISYAWAVRGATAATTPAAKALRQFLQLLAAGLATVSIAELTSEAVASFGRAVLRVAISAVLGAAIAFAQNAAEDSTADPAVSP